MTRHAGLTVLRAAAAYAGLVFGTGFLLGMIRVPFLVPRLGERTAELLETPLMFAAMYFASAYVISRPGFAMPRRRWLGVGGLAWAMVIAAELLLAVFLMKRSLVGYFADRDPVSGTVYYVLLLVFAVLPWLRAGAVIDSKRPVR
jgi:hypothetical protein